MFFNRPFFSSIFIVLFNVNFMLKWYNNLHKMKKGEKYFEKDTYSTLIFNSRDTTDAS